MAGDEPAIGFRVGAIEGRLTAVDERLRAVDRIEERVKSIDDTVDGLVATMDARYEADVLRREQNAAEAAKEKRQGRRDLFAVAGTIIAAIIAAAVALIQQGAHP